MKILEIFLLYLVYVQQAKVCWAHKQTLLLIENGELKLVVVFGWLIDIPDYQETKHSHNF